MFFILFLKFTLCCDFQYSLINQDPFYLEQFLKPGQTICINTTVENTFFVLNSLGNSTFKTYDQFNAEKELGYDEYYKETSAISFGKNTGSLVVTNSKNNESSISFISIAAISFPKDECESKAISNQGKDIIYFTLDDSNICYFNANGINFRYQFYVSSGVIEIRPPRNISQSVIIKSNLNDIPKSLNVKSTIKNIFLNLFNKRQYLQDIKSLNTINSPETIYITNNLTQSGVDLDNPSSFVLIDGYAPLIIYKPDSKSSSNTDKTYLMELGTNNHPYPNRLNSRFVSNEPGLIMSNKDDIDDNIFYGCDPYIYIRDQNGKKNLIDPNGRTTDSYYLEMLVKGIVLLLLFYIIGFSFMVYLFSFCCICPCCCCYNYCHKHSKCKDNHQTEYHSFDPGSSSIQFMQAGSSNYNIDADNAADLSNLNNINQNDNNDNGFVDNVTENSAYNINEPQNHQVEAVEEEEEVGDESVNNIEDEYNLHDLDDHHVRDSSPQL